MFWLTVLAHVAPNASAQPDSANEPVPSEMREMPTGMAGHFENAALAMLAVAVNDPKDAKGYAKALADNKEAPLPLREAAKGLVGKVGNPKKASHAVAQLAKTCANCHQAGARGPLPHDTERVTGATSTDRHIMAAMFVWIGLITPTEQPWRIGLEELLPPVNLESSDEVQAYGDEFKQHAIDAKAARSWDTRIEVFGKMLLTCSECHDAARVGGK